MTRWQLASLLAAAFLVGVLAVRMTAGVSDAVAQDQPEPSALPEPVDVEVDAAATTEAAPDIDASGGRLVCRLFLVDVASDGDIDTADRTTEVGQWVGTHVDAGMMLHGVDFEVGQKSTGYPQGYLQVCVYPG